MGRFDITRGGGRAAAVAGGLVAALLTVPAPAPASAAAAVAAVPSSPPSSLPSATLDWGPCPDLGEPADGVRCATLDVPLDHTDPGGRTIEIAVSRLASPDASKRRGVLFLNPGGTNRSELALPARLVAQGLPAEVRERYDLVTLDPRGIGRSTPVTCDLRPGQDLNIPPSQYARSPVEVARRAVELRAIARQCGESRTGDLLPHMSTANVARDMDRVRAALGEPKISYLGSSYGTYLGAVYSTLFPHRTDRVVLDSVVGPGGMDHTWSRRLGEGVEDRFGDFARWAADRHRRYGLGATPARVRAKYFELARRLDRRPAGELDGPGFRYLTFSSLFTDLAFPDLADTWRRADRGEAVSGGTGPGVIDFSGIISLACSDGRWARGLPFYLAAVERDRVRYPMFGASGANLWPCAFWPVRPAERPVRIGDAGPSNILMVSFLRDAGTPWSGAVEMRSALGSRARLVAVDGGGHVVYLSGVNACADDLVTRFLLTGKRPPNGHRCV